MAKVIVEDCLNVIPSKFELCVLAAQRAHAIAAGNKPAINTEANDKPTVTALREIEDTAIDVDMLKDAVMDKFSGNTKFSSGAGESAIPSLSRLEQELLEDLDKSTATTQDSQMDDMVDAIFSSQNMDVDD